MTVLTDAQRRTLDRTVQRARSVSEAAAREAVSRLAVDRESRPGYLTTPENDLRLALREKARLLGDETGPKPDLKLLIGDIACEQWHRLLFARLLEVNGLLRHPAVPDVPLSMDDCAELAAEEGEPDGWSVAARYAEEILPGVFRSSDPAVRLRFSPERRTELDAIVAELDRATLKAEDALGWVYQFWQTAEKKRVNDSGRKIGGADLAPVTQLFTENYMVRFLLENSLGAWWAGRHSDSPLLAEWDYLRRLDDGTPAAGTFNEWPKTAAEVTVMDPCCGSGHFLVAAFGMLWRMRAEEEGLADTDAQDAVLRDNLFGLELDPRCTQIAAFNVVLEAWKQGGFRRLKQPTIACSGIPIRMTADWEAFADHAESHDVMTVLQELFHSADTLGSLIDPDLAIHTESMLPGIDRQQKQNKSYRVETVFSRATVDAVKAATLLSRDYTLVATNPPFLSAGRQAETLRHAADVSNPTARGNLAYLMWRRWKRSSRAFVIPQNWRYQVSYSALREELLSTNETHLIGGLGVNGFTTTMWDFHTDLVVSSESYRRMLVAIDASSGEEPVEVAKLLTQRPLNEASAASQIANPDHRISMATIDHKKLLTAAAKSLQGIATGDNPRYIRKMWEVSLPQAQFRFLQSSVSRTQEFGGRDQIIWWKLRGGWLPSDRAGIKGAAAWGRQGVAVSQMGTLPATRYTGEIFDMNVAVVFPDRVEELPALWAYLSSEEYARNIRVVDSKLNVTNATLVKVTFDRERWQRVADKNGPLPEPHSNDPTQWLFKGTISNAIEPLQVAVARLLGYRWPDQECDELDELADNDGIVALPALTGELDAATRLRALLARAYGQEWSTQREQALIQQACAKRLGLAEWLRDEFFKQHTMLFHQRPFLWHIWDGRKDGFAAIVNYHRLDRRLLEKLAFTVLGTWIERQRADAADDVAGADLRLAAALELRSRLEAILVGEDPYDIYVRWKSLAEQPIGWEPDLDDGVRLNIRPFVTAGVLRAKVNVTWKKDRGTNPDGSERLNDLHPSLAERRAARAVGGSS